MPTRLLRPARVSPARRLGQCAAVAMLAAGLAGCAATAVARPLPADPMTITPQTTLLDQPVQVVIRGVAPGALTTVTAAATDSRGVTWTGSARFRARAGGVVSLDQPSLGGSYTGANPMGLFEFLTPPPSSFADTAFTSPKAGYGVRLQASVGGAIVGSATAFRQTPAGVGIVEQDLRPATGGLYGELFTSLTAPPGRPAVLVLGGSEGGLSSIFAASLLATHGYTTLALAYFGEPGLPDGLANIPLEYFAKALRLLRVQPGVDPRAVLVMGTSRGGEAALLLGAHYPQLVHGVIAGVPSSVVNPGYPDAGQPAWTLHGAALAPVRQAELGAPNPAADQAAVIPVEQIAGPVLLTCGGRDGVWPSCPYVQAIAARLAAHHFPYAVTTRIYPHAGHVAGGLVAYFSQTVAALGTQGGTLVGNQTALADGHERVLRFLAEQ